MSISKYRFATDRAFTALLQGLQDQYGTHVHSGDVNRPYCGRGYSHLQRATNLWVGRYELERRSGVPAWQAVARANGVAYYEGRFAWRPDLRASK
jgi:hypothetical protein